VVGPLAAGAVLLVAFAIVEGRIARAPLIPLQIFRLQRLRSANLVIFLLFSAVFAMWFFISLYQQQVLHHDALETGLGFLPMTLTVVAASTQAPRLVARFGAARVLGAGMLSAATGLALLTGVHSGGTYVAQVLPGGVLSAAGLGLSMVPGTIVAVQGVPAAQSGLASGLVNTSRLVGGALGLAVLSTLAASRTHARISDGIPHLSALADGYATAFVVGAAICIVGAFVATVLLRQRDTAPAAAVAESQP
jgi:Na+/melibiose symporter-like transporter